MSRPLNEYREERYMSINEFVKFLGISAHTFYAAVEGRRLHMRTMRKIAEKLGVHPSEIEEFVRKQSSTV
jgi:plasmid maintenance system antidote protein VapI